MNNGQYQPNNNQYQQNNQYQPGYNPNGYIPAPKSLPLYIILSIITCGIFEFYWLYTANEDLTALSRRPGRMNGGLVVLLSLVTCGIYLLVWLYQQGEALDEIKSRMGVPASNSGILYLILGIVSGGLIPLALIQNEINQIVTGRYGNIQ